MQGSGLSAWLIQRVTAVYLALFIIAAPFVLASMPALDYEHWRALLARPTVNIAVGLFYIALLFHAWVGGRDVAIDYVPNLPLRLVVLSALAFALIGLFVWVMATLVPVITL
jgi:succinate dehydrogenase / fumarate reductase membrane anchor subunit